MGSSQARTGVTLHSHGDCIIHLTTYKTCGSCIHYRHYVKVSGISGRYYAFHIGLVDRLGVSKNVLVPIHRLNEHKPTPVYHIVEPGFPRCHFLHTQKPLLRLSGCHTCYFTFFTYCHVPVTLPDDIFPILTLLIVLLDYFIYEITKCPIFLALQYVVLVHSHVKIM